MRRGPSFKLTGGRRMGINLSFLGAAGTVTGSKYLVDNEGSSILVECGLLAKAGARVVTSNSVAHATNGIDIGPLLTPAIRRLSAHENHHNGRGGVLAVRSIPASKPPIAAMIAIPATLTNVCDPRLFHPH